jgi:hypothetical protein
MEQTIEAGEKQASIFQRVINFMVIPAYIYFIAIPFFKWFWLPLLPKFLTGYEAALPEFGPMPEPTSSFSIEAWAYTIAKWIGWAAVLLVVILFLIWSKQESILYVPSQPIQHIT